MRLSRICAVAVVAALAAGCSSTASSTKISSPPSSAASAEIGGNPNKVPPSAAAALGTVDTAGSGCDAAAKPGDCWLPLYNEPALQGTVLNATTNPTDDHCQVKGEESGCWPQPGDKVQVLCAAIGADGLAYYGIHLPPDKQLTADPEETKQDALGGVIGYNRAQWVKLPAFTAAPVSCGTL